jgi:branched-chain amino acid transport system substrate-binding protein
MRSDYFKRTMTLYGSVFTVVVLVLLLTVQGATAQASGKSLKIGVLAPKTGFGASWFAAGAPGLQVAQEEIKSLGGVNGTPVEFIVYDTATKPQEAIQMMQKLTSTDKVLAIIGPSTSSECEVVFPIAVRSKIVSVGLLSAEPGISAKYRPWAFRNTLTSDKVYGPLVRKWASQNKVKTAAIIYDNKSAFTKADGEKVFPAVLQGAGIKLLGSVTYLTGDTDFSAQITKIKMWNPDGLVLATFGGEGGLIARECKRQNLNVAVVGSIDCNSLDFVRLAGSAAEGVWTSHSFWTDNPDPKVQRVMKRAKTILGDKDPDLTTARYYDNAMIMYHLLKTMGVTNRPEDLALDREKMRNGWETLKDFPGVEGKITMNKDGDGEKSSYIFVIKGGKYINMSQ